MDGPRWFNGTHIGGDQTWYKYMVILCHAILHWKCVHCLGWQEKQTPIMSWTVAVAVGGREFRRFFRGISWVYEITKYFRYKKTMADGEEDEYEAHLDHLQRSKDLKAKSWFGKYFFPTSPLKNMNLPQDVGKKTSPQNGWLTSLGLVSKLQKSEKKKPWGGQIFFSLKNHAGNHAGILKPAVSGAGGSVSSLSFQKKENQP